MVPPSGLSESEAAAERSAAKAAASGEGAAGGSGRSAVKIPGPVESSMQKKVSTLMWETGRQNGVMLASSG